jgi:hypothetical protein
VAFERPRCNDLYADPGAIDVINEFQLRDREFDGHMLGLNAQFGKHSGQLIRKPWKFVTEMFQVAEQFDNSKCPGAGRHEFHAPCQGQGARLTEKWTLEMIDRLCSALYKACAYACAVAFAFVFAFTCARCVWACVSELMCARSRVVVSAFAFACMCMLVRAAACVREPVGTIVRTCLNLSPNRC